MEHARSEIQEMNYPEFDAEKMDRFIQKDLFAAKIFEGIKSGTIEERLEIVFNSCILEDSHMIKSYVCA